MVPKTTYVCPYVKPWPRGGARPGARRGTEGGAVAAREVVRRAEPAGRGHLQDGHRGLQQQLARTLQACLQVVLLGRIPQVALEEPLHLPAREPGARGERIERERLLDVLVHQLRHGNQALVSAAHLGAQRHVLRVALAAHPLHDELLGDELRGARAELAAHQCEHQIERGHPARAGEAVAVDRKELIAQLHPRELLAQRREVLPVDRGAVVIEQPRPRERVAAGAQRAERDAALREPAQRRKHRGGDRGAHLHPAADEQNVHPRQPREG